MQSCAVDPSGSSARSILLTVNVARLPKPSQATPPQLARFDSMNIDRHHLVT